MHTLHAHNRLQQADNVATGCLARLLLLLEQAGGTLSISLRTAPSCVLPGLDNVCSRGCRGRCRLRGCDRTPDAIVQALTVPHVWH